MTATLIFSDSFELEQAISAVVYAELNDKYNFNFDFEENGIELTITTFEDVTYEEMLNICDDLHIDLYEYQAEFADFSIHQ